VQLPAGIAPSAALTTTDAVATGVTTTASVAAAAAAAAAATTTEAGVHGHTRALVILAIHVCNGSLQQLR